MPASAAPAERGGPSLASLPDSALVIIFSKCSMSDRLQRLSLVCKEWRDLCASPSLVSKVAVKGTGDDALQRMRSLQLWLARHWGPQQVPNAASVQELSLSLRFLSQDAAELQQLIAAAAASCGPRLQNLEIRISGQLILSGWMCGLKGLTCLSAFAGLAHVPVSLTALTALESLELLALSLEHPAGSWLPPNLTSLACAHVCLPEQATSLQRLRQVQLKHQPAATLAGSLAVVTRLAPSFHSLTIQGSLGAIPPELAALSGRLQSLQLNSTHPNVVDIGSISGLTSLTYLYLQAPTALGPATGLQQLSRLQQLCVHRGPSIAAGASQAFAPMPPGQLVLRSLPPGGWMRSLTHLWLDYDVLFGSLDVLPAASSLHSLAIMHLQPMPAAPPRGEPQPDWAALRSWLCTHPPLLQLFLEHCSIVRGEWLDLVLYVSQRRPGLVVKRAS